MEDSKYRLYFQIHWEPVQKKSPYQIKIKNPKHNHPPSEDPSIHSAHRRLNEPQINMVHDLTHAGVAPLKIKSALM